MRQTAAERKRKARDRYYRKNYDGFSAADFDRLWECQGYACALCGRKKDRRYMALDHSHATGAVRSIVCRVPCNRDLISALDAQGIPGYTRAIDLLTLYRQGIPGF